MSHGGIWDIWAAESAEIARLTFPAAAEAVRAYESDWVDALADAHVTDDDLPDTEAE